MKKPAFFVVLVTAVIVLLPAFVLAGCQTFVLGRGNDHDDGYDLVGEYVHGFQLVARGFRLVVHVHHGHDRRTGARSGK